MEQKGRRILEGTKPEAVYVAEPNGQRGAILIIDLADPSQVAALAQPGFLEFNAKVELSADDF